MNNKPHILTAGILACAHLGCSYHPAHVPDTGQLEELSVVTDSGNVEVGFANVPEPVITHRRGEFSARSTPRFEVSDDGTRLTISDGCESVESPICHVDFRIQLPARPTLLRLTSDSGELEVSGASGELVASTDSGNLLVLDSHLNLLKMATDSGDVRLTRSRAGELALLTDSGRLKQDRLSSVEKLSVSPLPETQREVER